MKQVFYHYTKWEEYKQGMWRVVEGKQREGFLKKAIEFTGNAKLYGSYMLKVVEQWPISCEQNLTCNNINQQAWIGHAACCIAIDCPEDIVREAWSYLTEKQQIEANKEADKAILLWKDKYKKQNGQLSLF
jgi:hypothetical protein